MKHNLESDNPRITQAKAKVKVRTYTLVHVYVLNEIKVHQEWKSFHKQVCDQ